MDVARPRFPRRAALTAVVLPVLASALLLPPASPAATSTARAAGAATWSGARAAAAPAARTARAIGTRAAIVRRASRGGLPAWLRRLASSGSRAFAATAGTPAPGTGTAVPAPGGGAAPLRFGIYPGGPAGAVGPSGVPKPEDPARRLAALRELRGGKPFVLHLYEAYTQPADGAALPAWLEPQVREATANGFEVEMVLRYRPAAAGGDVAGFADFVRRRVRQYGAIPGVTALQITNEVNITVAPDAADGAYAGAREALVRGLLAAHEEARAAGRDGLQLGFNWAYETSADQAALFRELGAIGGSAFAAAVDWVGIDAYPGTWGPTLSTGDLASAVRDATIGAMRTLRRDLLPLAGLDRAAIRFAENGYPTDAAERTEARQVTVMSAAIAAVHEHRATYGVTDYRWFDLRDADSDHASFESHYGILRDDYAPKPGFARLRDLVAQLG